MFMYLNASIFQFLFFRNNEKYFFHDSPPPLRGGFSCRTSPKPLIHKNTHSEGYFQK